MFCVNPLFSLILISCLFICIDCDVRVCVLDALQATHLSSSYCLPVLCRKLCSRYRVVQSKGRGRGGEVRGSGRERREVGKGLMEAILFIPDFLPCRPPPMLLLASLWQISVSFRTISVWIQHVPRACS